MIFFFLNSNSNATCIRKKIIENIMLYGITAGKTRERHYKSLMGIYLIFIYVVYFLVIHMPTESPEMNN